MSPVAPGRLLLALLPMGGLAAAAAELSEGGWGMRPHPDPARDAAVRALVWLVPRRGWTVSALREAAGADADLLFPGGPAEMVEAHAALLDRETEHAAAALEEQRQSRRVRALLLHRLALLGDHREAVRRGLTLLSLPGNRPVALRMLARTADAIWSAAGDRSDDWSRHSRRAILAGVYAATLLFWLRDGDMAKTEAFLDRRLGDVRRLGQLRVRLPRLG